MRSCTFLLCSYQIAAACAEPALVQEPTSFVALVIGNDAYGGEYILSSAYASARAVAYHLQTSGFQTTAAYDARRDKMEGAVGKFLSMLNSGCTALIYFAGHCWQAADSKECYLAPASVDFQQGSLNPAGARVAVLCKSCLVHY